MSKMLPSERAARIEAIERRNHQAGRHGDRKVETCRLCVNMVPSSEPLDAAEHDAGSCPSCGLTSCVGRLDYESCTHPGLAQARAENTAPQRLGGRP